LAAKKNRTERRSGPGELAAAEEPKRGNYGSRDENAIIVGHRSEARPARDVLEEASKQTQRQGEFGGLGSHAIAPLDPAEGAPDTFVAVEGPGKTLATLAILDAL
jgi:hypothetical protein